MKIKRRERAQTTDTERQHAKTETKVMGENGARTRRGTANQRTHIASGNNKKWNKY